MIKNYLDRQNELKAIIDADIDRYCRQLEAKTLKSYGLKSVIVSNAFSDLLQRGGKRIRGSLTIIGYEMCGGIDTGMIIKAARAVEMMHAYMLIIDDIQDRSNMRRGGPTVHKLLESSHQIHKWSGSQQHIGLALALNAALLGSHGAEMILANLNVEEDLKLKAINIMNHTIIVTAHGQTHDIINQVDDIVLESEIDKTMQWKTAHYSILNPLHTGMVLAGAPCEDTNAITGYAIDTGKAFQIIDDLTLVSRDNTHGKETADDIREGKKSLMMAYALKNASSADSKFLKSCLGNQDCSEDDFETCRNILIGSGAVTYAKKKAEEYVGSARESLHRHANRWNPESVSYLDEFAQHLLSLTV